MHWPVQQHRKAWKTTEDSWSRWLQSFLLGQNILYNFYTSEYIWEEVYYCQNIQRNDAFVNVMRVYLPLVSLEEQKRLNLNLPIFTDGFMIPNISHHLSNMAKAVLAWYYCTCKWLSSVVWWCDCWWKEIFGCKLSFTFCSLSKNATKLTEQCFMVQADDAAECKETQSFCMATSLIDWFTSKYFSLSKSKGEETMYKIAFHFHTGDCFTFLFWWCRKAQFWKVYPAKKNT